MGEVLGFLLQSCRTMPSYPTASPVVNALVNEPVIPGEFLLYETEDGRTRVDCRFVEDSLWLSQTSMADLFQTTKQNIAKHLKAIFSEGELVQASVVNQWLTTAADGKNYRVAHYNLDAILAVGYRVREIFAMAADYSPTLPETTRFFRFIQNKLHFAVTGKTAAELIAERADSTQPHMGLTSWKSGSVQKADVTVAKNYLQETEIQSLNRIVTMWLDYAEDQALRRKEVFLMDWAEKLDAFLTFNERQVLEGAGKVSNQQATAHAQAQYEQFVAQRRALLESEGAEFQMRALEDAAKALPQPAKD